MEKNKRDHEQQNDEGLMNRVNEAFDHMVQDVKEMVQDNEKHNTQK